ncbi:MAG: sensor histidine kinase, partial [Bacteroidetes bacterium]|nr:sensor histidine kinase [Bacteroidota bacterium]
DGSVEIEIQDHGLGIDPGDIPHLFEPFYRSQAGDVQKHGGVGLGLALVKHIIDAHQGRIDVRSTPGEGSTFIISLNSVEAA